MRILDLIDPYPITEHLVTPPWETPEQIEQRRRALRTVKTPDELARLMAILHGDNALPNALHKSLNANEPYRIAKSLTPFLKDSPAISVYRNSHKRHDPVAVIKEILATGIYLPAGQVLFHGGPWLGSTSFPPIGTQFSTSQPLSTTLCPQVAAVHAHYDPPGFLWKISICSPIPCFVFNNRNRCLGHEFEVLLPPIKVVCTAVESSGMYTPLIHVLASF